MKQTNNKQTACMIPQRNELSILMSSDKMICTRKRGIIFLCRLLGRREIRTIVINYCYKEMSCLQQLPETDAKSRRKTLMKF